MTADLESLYAAIDATWPAAEMTPCEPWLLRDGQGGGKRVSAATAEEGVTDADIPSAEAAMRELGQDPLFMVRQGQDALDGLLEARGYQVVDPVNLYLGPIAPLADAEKPRALVFAIWPPLAIQKDIWVSGGIGPARVAVMDRVSGPKTAILGRHDQTAAATAFVAISGNVAMVHAVEVIETCRGLGVGRMVTQHAARWAQENGATQMAVLCTKANVAANALYASLGLSVVGQYHYRMLSQ